MTLTHAPLRPRTALTLLLTLGSLQLGCSSASPSGKTPELIEGQSDFASAPPNGNGRGGGSPELAAGDAASTTAPAASNGNSKSTSSSSATPRTVEETDLYRLDGDRLYYLNQYRGLMVFDVSDVDHPALLGRSPIYGSPIEMVVRGGIASVVVADWYGTMDDGTPFHGSIVRGIDARDPANMKVTGEALLGGWVRDTRVVGDVLYAVTEKYPYDYGWYGLDGAGVATSAGSSNGPQVSVASVNFADGEITAVDNYDVPGYGGVFHVTSSAILLASDVLTNSDQFGGQSTGQSELRYLDISDPGGEIREGGSVIVDGSVQSWGADGGRWNLDFADSKTAHVVGRTYDYTSSNSNNGLSITTADFTDPMHPKVTGSLSQPMPAWDATARFDGSRLYLTASNWGCSYDSNGNATGTLRTPLDVYDLSDMTHPTKLGSSTIDGQVSLMIPNGDRLFALGNTYDCSNGYQSPISLAYFDMTDPTSPKSLGTADFGKGWAWTPAAGTFKAFTKNDAEGLVVLPFSGWDPAGDAYNNGLQLIEFTDQSIATSGTAKTKGWVERGIFVKDRLVSLSDLALTVVDYSQHDKPSVVAELTLARNVVNVKPVEQHNVVEVSSDFWDNDVDHSTLRVLPIDQVEENVSDPALASLEIEGTNPTVFHDGDLSLVVSNVRREIACPDNSGSTAPDPGLKAESYKCYGWTQVVQAVDTSGGSAHLRGKIALPDMGNGYGWGWGWGWYGCGLYDWYYGSDVVQVGGNKLAFRRWQPQYDSSGAYVDALQSLFVVDASDPDAPTLASVVVTRDQDGWWGNLRSVGDQLYATHYEWEAQGYYDEKTQTYNPGTVRYYLDKVDLSDASHPRIAQKINVPGMLIGGSETDPSLIYTMDYHWDGTNTTNDLAVLKLHEDRAYLQGHVAIPGGTGNVYVRGNTAYFSVQEWQTSDAGSANVRLYQVDLSDAQNPVVLPSKQAKGWGWLLGVEGDRAFVTSGWANQGVDIFKLSEGSAPVFDQFVRTRGWWTSSLSRQGNKALLASGYWGTQVVELE
jgi:hypothetical protein